MRRHGLRRDLASCCSDRLTQKVKQSWPRSILQRILACARASKDIQQWKKRYTATHTHDVHSSVTHMTNQIQTKSRSLKLRGNASQRSRAAAKPAAEHTAQHSTAQHRYPPQPPTAQTSTCLRARVHTHTHCTHMRSRCRYHPVPRWRPRATAPSTRARKSAAVQH